MAYCAHAYVLKNAAQCSTAARSIAVAFARLLPRFVRPAPSVLKQTSHERTLERGTVNLAPSLGILMAGLSHVRMRGFACSFLAPCLAFALTDMGCAPQPAKPIVLVGQVFVVSKAKLAFTLPLVEVDLLPANETIARVTAKRKEGIEWQARVRMSDLARDSSELDEVERALAAARRRADKVESDYIGGRVDAERWQASRAEVPRQEARLSTALQSQKANKRRLAAFESAEYVCDSLPPAVVSTKTDAGGNFSLDVPAVGSFVVSAAASREIFGVTERHIWLVRLSPDILRSGRLLLNNENTVTSGSSDSIVQLPESREATVVQN